MTRFNLTLNDDPRTTIAIDYVMCFWERVMP